jgi:hypothetical protein
MAIRDIVPVPGASFEETLSSAGPDLLREMIKGFAQRMMDAEVETICGAGYGEVSPERVLPGVPGAPQAGRAGVGHGGRHVVPVGGLDPAGGEAGWYPRRRADPHLSGANLLARSVRAHKLAMRQRYSSRRAWSASANSRCLTSRRSTYSHLCLLPSAPTTATLIYVKHEIT